MLIFQVAEGLIVKEHAKAKNWVEVFYHNEHAYAWIDGHMSKLDPIDKPAVEYTWNELRDLLDKMRDKANAFTNRIDTTG